MANKKLNSYCLVSRMSPFWDSFMLLPVLEWLDERNIHASEDIAKTRKAVLDAASSNEDKEVPAVQRAAGLEYYLKSYITALVAYKKDQQNRMGGIPEKKTLAELSDWCSKSKMAKDVKEEDLPFPSDCNEKLLHLTKVLYRLGEYTRSKRYFDFYLHHACELIYEGIESERRASCYWGIAAAIILNNTLKSSMHGDPDVPNALNGIRSEEVTDDSFDIMKMDDAVQSLLKLGEILDSASLKMKRDVLMLQRSWILHWSIWPIFRYYLPMIFNETSSPPPMAACWNTLIDGFLDERNVAIVPLVCPHVMRYYTVYGILNRKRKDHFQTIIKLVSSTKAKYSDPFTSLLEALFVDYNFDVAQQYMSEIGVACSADFFLDPLKLAIEEHSRLLIFEIYCRIHKSINLDMIAKKLNMPPEGAEHWIVNLIRHAKLEAKIDSEKNRVEMTASLPTIYQQVLDKSRNVITRTGIIYQNFTHNPTGKTDGDTKEAPLQIRSSSTRNLRSSNWGRSTEEAENFNVFSRTHRKQNINYPSKTNKGTTNATTVKFFRGDDSFW